MKKLLIILSAMILSAAAVGCSDSDSSGGDTASVESTSGADNGTNDSNANDSANDNSNNSANDSTNSGSNSKNGEESGGENSDKADDEIGDEDWEEYDEDTPVDDFDLPEGFADDEVYPLMECENLAEAESTSGITFKAPDAIDTFKDPVYCSQEDGVIEITYTEEDGDNIMFLRKGKNNEEAIGEDNSYVLSKLVRLADVNVTISGDDDMMYFAKWKIGEFKYTLYVDYGMEEETMKKQIENIIKKDK